MKKPTKKSRAAGKTKKAEIKKTVAGNAFKKSALELKPAPLEAYPPQALLITGKDYIVKGCDGDNEYIWIATHIILRGEDAYKVTEVYPGFAAKKTNLRVAKEAKDLVLPGCFESLSHLLEELEEQLFADFEDSNEDIAETEDKIDAYFENEDGTPMEPHEPHPVADAVTERP